MSQVLPIHPESFDVELPIHFPKKRERYKITSVQLKTDLDLTPRQRVRIVDAYGYVAKMALDASGEENEARWTVIVDECVLEEVE